MSPISHAGPASSRSGQFTESLQAIGTALKSGDLPGAQSALTTFQQSLSTHLRAAALTVSTPSSSSGPFGDNARANTDYQNLKSALQNGNVANARQAFLHLQSDLKTGVSLQPDHRGCSGAFASAATPNGPSHPASTWSVTA